MKFDDDFIDQQKRTKLPIAIFHVQQFYIQLVSWGYIGVERTPHPDTSGNRGTKPDPRYPTRLEFQDPEIKVNCSFHIHCVIYDMTTKSSWCVSSKNCCPINHLAVNRHVLLHKIEDIEEFCQSALGKPDLDRVLI